MLHVFYSSAIYTQSIQSFIHSRLSTADYTLLVAAMWGFMSVSVELTCHLNCHSCVFHCRNTFVEVEVTLQLTVSQSVCQGFEPTLGLVTKGCFLKFAVLSLWGSLSDERSGLPLCSTNYY
jgi:NAD-dependent dihydropyrimidine dehydrogenase PreA subunit